MGEYMKLKFAGEVCADDYACYSKCLNRLGEVGDSYVVGDTVFIVKQPKLSPVIVFLLWASFLAAEGAV